jgi:hypothetical protein
MAMVFGFDAFLADPVFGFFTDFVDSAVAVVVEAVDAPAAQGKTSDLPPLPAFSALAASLFRIANERQRAFVALPASLVPAATQMHALFAPQAFSSILKHGDAFAVLVFAAGLADPAGAEEPGSGELGAEVAADSGAGLASPAAGADAAAFFCLVLCLTGAAGGGGAVASSVGWAVGSLLSATGFWPLSPPESDGREGEGAG